MEKGSITKHSFAEKIEVSVVIPHFYSSRNDNLDGLLEDLKNQTFKGIEVIVVHGVSPQGKAINQGVRVAQGEILVLIDDDSRLGHGRVIENLVNTLRENPSVGMAGGSVAVSEHANAFQRAAARQFPRFQMQVVNKLTDSDLPGHPCAGFRKSVFIQAGMEREDILRGLDPDLRMRIRKIGYRVVLVPNTWIYHPMPDSLSKFIRTFLRNGFGSAYLQIVHPEINYDTDEALDSKYFVAKHSFLYRILRYPFRLAKSLLTFQWIRFLGYSVYLIGYLAGYIRFGIFRNRIEQRRGVAQPG